MAARDQFVWRFFMYSKKRSPWRARFVARFCVLSACFALSSAHAQNTLSLDAALRMALEHSQTLAAKDQAVLAAQALSVAAAQLPDPSLKLGVNNLPVTGADKYSLTRDFMTMRSVGLAQEWVRADKRQALSARYDSEAQVALAQRRMSEQDIQRETAQAWLTLHFQQRVHQLLNQQSQEMALQLQSVQAAYRVLKASQADVLSARLALAQVKDQLAQSQRLLALGQTQLMRWTGSDVVQALNDLPDFKSLHWQVDDLQSLNDHHPTLVVMQKAEAVAQAELDLAKANRRPNWSAELMFNKRGSEFSDMVSLNFSRPLQWNAGNLQEREVAAKTAALAQLQAERLEASREHLAQVSAVVQTWRSNQARLQEFEATQLPLAQLRTQAAEVAYKNASGSLNDVLQTRRMALETQMDYLRLALETAQQWAQLNYLTPVRN